MAQRSSRKRRKERRRAASAGRPSPEAASGAEPTPASDPGAAPPDRYARSRAKDEEARRALKPLRAGERPRAVTVAGVLALVLGLANLGAYAGGLEVQGKQPAFAGVAVYSALMFAAAYGCFRMRYWAVLGMEALLGLGILIFSLLAVRAGGFVELLIAVAVIASSGTLFWFLVKSMARIQMPPRPGQ